jgi:DNA polymerase-3 subunit beta
MDLTIERADLSRILSRAASVTSAKSPMLPLQHVLLDAADGRLSARATDLYMGAESSAVCDVAKPGSLAVDARRAAEIAKSLPVGVARLRLVKSQLEISSGKSKFKLGVYPAEDYPSMPRLGSGPATFGVFASADLLRCLAQGAHAALQDDSKPELNGALFESSGGTLKITSTDSKRLAVSGIRGETCSDASIVVPIKGVAALRALCDSCKENIGVSVIDRTAFFFADHVCISSKLVEDPFPKADRVIQYSRDAVKHTVRVDRQLTVDALARVSIVSASEKVHADVSIAFAPGSMTMSAANTASDEGEDEVACDADFTMRLIVNPKYMLDALKAAIDDVVTIGVSSELGAIVVHGSDPAEYTGVVMTIRPR